MDEHGTRFAFMFDVGDSRGSAVIARDARAIRAGV